MKFGTSINNILIILMIQLFLLIIKLYFCILAEVHATLNHFFQLNSLEIFQFISRLPIAFLSIIHTHKKRSAHTKYWIVHQSIMISKQPCNTTKNHPPLADWLLITLNVNELKDPNERVNGISLMDVDISIFFFTEELKF